MNQRLALELSPDAKLKLPRSVRESARVGVGYRLEQRQSGVRAACVEGQRIAGDNTRTGGSSSGNSCVAERVAKRIHRSHVLMVEDVEALVEKLQLDAVGKRETLGQKQI